MRKQGSLYGRLSVNVYGMSILVVEMIWRKVRLMCPKFNLILPRSVPVIGCCEAKPCSSWFSIVLEKSMAINAVV